MLGRPTVQRALRCVCVVVTRRANTQHAPGRNVGRRGRNVMKEVGVVRNRRPGPDNQKSLQSLRFQTGDFLDVAIYI